MNKYLQQKEDVRDSLKLLLNRQLNATNVRNRQKRTRDAGMMEAEKIIAENNLDENKVILVNTTNILDKNLTGLVANQIMAKYQKPTFF